VPATTRLALPYPSPSDPNNVPSDLQKLANALDTIAADYASGTAASRPVAGINGRFYLATDTGALSLDNGTAWATINASLVALLQNKGDLFVASAAGNAARLAAGSDGQALVARAAATNGVDYELQLGQPMNLTGTGSATRFVGGTVSGPPVTGTFAVGDFVVTQAGTICVCTTAGTPGTWVSITPPQPRVVARARRATTAALASGTTLASSSAVASLTAVPVTAGRLYRVYTSSLLVYSNGATTMAVAQTAVTYTTDGSTPSANSALLKQDNVQVAPGGSTTALTISLTYAPTATGTLGVLLSYFQPITGGGTSVGMTGSAVLPIELVVEDIGADPGATGNVSY